MRGSAQRDLKSRPQRNQTSAQLQSEGGTGEQPCHAHVVKTGASSPVAKAVTIAIIITIRDHQMWTVRPWMRQISECSVDQSVTIVARITDLAEAV
jgi:hypothetical protein